MFSKILSFASLAIVSVLFTSCGNSGVAVLSKSNIQGVERREAGSLPGPSSDLVEASKSKPRDKHSMPIYSFAERRRVVRTTAYTCSEDDHLIYGSKNATGTQLRYNNRVRSAAADWSFYPVGTTFRIKGMPYLYVVDDYGSALTGTGTIDIYKPTKDVMNLWGRRTVEVNIVQWGSFTRSAELLSQRQKFSHCRQMLSNIIRQKPELGRTAMR
ncbi:MAG: 3D domain-containing protein [Akkermansiaceae bacterium]|nr:3D domain-containing protein [Akkermansiaceae bacterium]MCP5545511.1 3D domain-containing protein [Akkermansiaceae bacterium]MCP5545782.1 3D domain-containing protein [Akkermansiaceae bacterium]